MRKLFLGAMLLLAGCCFLNARVDAQQTPQGEKPANEKKAVQAPADQDPMAEMMAKWKELNSKGPEHERFKKMEGVWSTETKMWMAPDTEPMISTGSAKFRLILDGRYVEQKFTCDMMGEKFEGIGIDGYDRIKKKCVSIWMDNQSTAILMSEGTADETGKVTTYYGKMDDPIAGVKDKVVKSVAREIDENKVIYEMYDTTPDGKEFKTMEITYTRDKGTN